MPIIYLSEKQRTFLLGMLHDEGELLEERVEHGTALPEQLEEVCLLYDKLVKSRK